MLSQYPDMEKTMGEFTLEIKGGEFTDSEIMVMLGENGETRTDLLLLLWTRLRRQHVTRQSIWLFDKVSVHAQPNLKPPCWSWSLHLSRPESRPAACHPDGARGKWFL